MADCGDYDYQAIEYRGLFDLKDAQIIRAEIDSIDQANNCAAVTLLDTCEQAEWIDVSAIPFFYHCENSTGTVEDLANGYKAFSVGDMVYILANKENGEIPAQAHIIGHIDQMGTNSCLSEVILITLVIPSALLGGNVYAIYVPSTGGLLDIDAFVNKDEYSPDKPAASIGIYTSAVSAWFEYNFATVVPTVTVPHSITRYQSYVTTGFLPRNYLVDSTVAYTGTGWVTTSEGNACDGFNTGNEYYNRETEYEILRDPEESSDLARNYVKESKTFIGAGTFHYGDGSENNCSFYWQATEYHYETSKFYGTTGMRYVIYDGVSSQSYTISVQTYISTKIDSSTSCDGSVISGTINRVTSTVNTIDFSAFGATAHTNTFNYSYSASFSNPGPGYGAAIYTQPTTASGYYVADVQRGCSLSDVKPVCLFPPYTNQGTCFIIGNEGVYGITGCAFYQELHRLTSGATSTVSVGGYPNLTDTVPGWGKGFSCGPTNNDTEYATARFSVAGRVTFYAASGIDTTSPVSITECIANANNELSQKFADAVVGLLEYLLSLVSVGDVYSYIAGGPLFRLVKKREA